MQRYSGLTLFGGLRKPGALAAVTLFIVAVALLAISYSAPSRHDPSAGLAFNSMFYPRLLLVAWAVLCVAVALREAAGGDGVASVAWGPPVALALIMAGYVFLFSRVGFLAASIAFFCIACPLMGYRRPLPVITLSIAIPTVIFILFRFVMGFVLPTSPFSPWV